MIINQALNHQALEKHVPQMRRCSKNHEETLQKTHSIEAVHISLGKRCQQFSDKKGKCLFSLDVYKKFAFAYLHNKLRNFLDS